MFVISTAVRLASKSNIAALNNDLPDDICIFDVKRVTKGFNARTNANARTYSYTLPTIAFSHYNEQASLKDFRVSSDQLNSVNQILQHYKGSHRFHNFTVDIDATDQSAWRVMHHLKCSQPFIVDGVEFAVIYINGRSFMMHQIRKMIGLMLAVVREATDASVFERAFGEKTVHVPTAPGLGLVLEQVHYDLYNRRFGDNGNVAMLEWDDVDEVVNKFQKKYIEPTITQNEIENELMLNWVEELLAYNYEIVSDAELEIIKQKRIENRK